MKKKAKLVIAVLLFLAAAFSSVYADTIAIASRSDFDELVTLWSEAYSSNTYDTYQEKLCATAESIIPDEMCQDMLAEALFYKYYASSFIAMPENEKLDTTLTAVIEYCNSFADSIPAVRTVFELFSSVQKSAPFKSLSTQVYFEENTTERPVEESMMPDAATGRLLMLRTLAEVDAMSQRFKKASESRGGDVLLKFSRDAYLNVMEKPAMVFVINNEPLYADLRDVLERSSDGIDAETFGSTADAFYRLESLIGQCEDIAAIKGLPLSDILSVEAWTVIMLYHTDPFAVLSLNDTALERLNSELAFIAEYSVPYIERINALPEKRDGVR